MSADSDLIFCCSFLFLFWTIWTKASNVLIAVTSHLMYDEVLNYEKLLGDEMMEDAKEQF